MYAIGTLLQWLAKIKAVNRQRDDTLESLMSQMASPDPSVRPQLDLVAQVKSGLVKTGRLFRFDSLAMYGNIPI